MKFERRILVVEDDIFMGSLIADALSHHKFITKVVRDSVSAVKELDSFDPDAVLVDLELGDGPNGIELVRIVCKNYPHIAAILLSKHPDLNSAGFNQESVPEGVAYLRKNLVNGTKELILSIEAVMRGQVSALRHDKISKGKLDLLTKTQREILEMMSRGLSNVEIARKRNVGLSAIEKRITEIYDVFDIPRDDSTAPRVKAVTLYLSELGLSALKPYE